MMRGRLLAGSVVLLAAVTGCTPGGATTPAPAAGTTAATDRTADWVVTDNPQYTAWAKFKPGTRVKQVETTATEGGRTVSTITFTLVEVAPAEVVLTLHNHTRRYDGYETDNTMPLRNPRPLRLPPGKTVVDFARPTTTKEEGRETVQAAGRDYPTTWYKSSDRNESGPVESTVWLSDEMPGQTVKSVVRQPARKATTTLEVVEVTVP